jgi:hypothetical protein
MFRLIAVAALVFCAYLGLLQWMPREMLLNGFSISGHFIAYYWCALAVFGLVSHSALGKAR